MKTENESILRSNSCGRRAKSEDCTQTIPEAGRSGAPVCCTPRRKSRYARATYLHVLEAVLLAYASQHIFLAAFLHFPSQKEFIQNKICLLEVEDDVQLAHVAIVLVHLFHVSMNDLEGDQFIVCRGTTGDEKERCIAAIDNFGVW